MSRRRARTPPILATKEQAPTAWFLLKVLIGRANCMSCFLTTKYSKANLIGVGKSSAVYRKTIENAAAAPNLPRRERNI